MGDAFEKSGQNAAQRRKGGVVLEPHKNSFSKNSLVFVLPVSFAVLLADMKAEAVQTLQLRPDILNRKMESCPDTIRLRSCQFFDNSGRKPGQFLSGDTVAL